MKQCGDNRFCCAADCDCSRTRLFELDAATFLATLPISSVLSTSTHSLVSTSATTTPASQSTSTLPLSSPSEIPSSQSQSHRLAIGAGVGAGLGVLLLAAVGMLAWYLLCRQRALKATRHQELYGDNVSEGSAKVVYAQIRSVNELPAEIRHEMDGLNVPQEMDGVAKCRHHA
ncbi:hypothetical protein SVAN01_10596 [Stagonosporopsis vannaccii]|nr:hypothetical protein SVAN01_10596 [Stagonosporopsis vannaccii]